MKNPNSFNLRIASAITLMSGAAALAFVATSNNILITGNGSPGTATHRLMKPQAQYGLASRNEASDKERAEDPTAAATQHYSNRAYPATDVPFRLTVNAKNAWARIKSQNNRNSVATAAWTLAGPSTANFPAILTFSGAAYTTSGRVTALAIDPACSNRRCTVWVGAAGGGVWRTDNALSGSGANWTFVSGSFATNAIGTLTYDSSTGTLYAGTGEPNASGDSEAGFGIYKSTNRGDTWVPLAANTSVPLMPTTCGDAPAYTGPAFNGRAISSIVIDPTNSNIMYVGSTRAVRGVASVTGGGVSLAPGLPPFGFWKSTDGGANFALINAEGICLNPGLPGDAGKIQSSFGSIRGVHDIESDPYDHNMVYAAPFPAIDATRGGVWRSTDSGATWTQIKNALNPALNTDRASFSVTPISGGRTRMYVGDGNSSISAANQARVYRTDDAAVATNASFTDLTAVQQASSAPNQTLNYCGDPAVRGAQCWYDNVVYSPPGKPDVVYIGGSYSYNTAGGRNNGRAFLRSTDAGLTFSDATRDAITDPAPNGMHPDSHAIVEIPGTDSAIFGSDGGVVRTSGTFTNIASQCDGRSLAGSDLLTCQQLLSAVPSFIYSLNKGLSTLQFQSLSVAADNPKHLQGGTQDNGTFETTGSTVVWPQIIYGDGGQSGFNATNSSRRFNTFTGQANDANFQNGDPSKWVIISAPIISSPESAFFYPPIIADPHPTNAGSIYQGSQSVWRTQDWGGDQATLEANCPEFTTPANQPGCGDFVQIGPPGSTDLTGAAYGGDRLGNCAAGVGCVAAIERAPSDTNTLWVATGTGRLFISTNANAAAGSVTYTRLDTLPSATNDPGRFISGIYVDPANPNHAWVSYGSYSTLTPGFAGHVFEVTYNPATPNATWTSLDGSGGTAFPDFPANDIVRDSNGDLYVSNDWGVLRLANGSSNWEVAGSGLPMVEVAGLTIVPGSRVLYAATHGRSAWKLTLP